MSSDKKSPKRGRRTRLILVALTAVVACGAIVTILLSKIPPSEDAPATLSTVAAPSLPEETPSAPLPTEAPPSSPSPGAQPSSSLSVGIKVGQLAPDFTLPGLTSTALSLSDLRGRVVLLDFWASWCAPCRATMPSLEALAARYKDEGVVLVGVSLDRTAEDATSYLRASGSSRLVALWGSLAQAREVARVYEIVGIPHTFVIDRQGIIRFADHPARLKDTLIDAWL